MISWDKGVAWRLSKQEGRESEARERIIGVYDKWRGRSVRC